MTHALLPAYVRQRLYARFDDLKMPFRADRAYFDYKLLPSVGDHGGTVLFIGCQRYTRRYPSMLAARGTECWTIDVDPTVARWGAPQRHIIGDIRNGSSYWLPASFDIVILNGVFGFGLDCAREQDEALLACRRLLRDHGWLILGWNYDRSDEPSELPTLRDHFEPLPFAGLPQRQMFAKSTHVYGTFRLQAT